MLKKNSISDNLNEVKIIPGIKIFRLYLFRRKFDVICMNDDTEAFK